MSSEMRLKTLAYLLRIREDMQRGRLLMYLGEERIERLACFIEGYRTCLRVNGAEDEAYEGFVEGLRGAREQALGERWPEELLRDCHGNHEQAIRRFLNLAAEFFAREGVSAALPGGGVGAAEEEAGSVGTLEVLLRIRQEMAQGPLSMRCGGASAECFETFVEGCHACMLANGLADEEYGRFFEWLRDVRQELPGEGWPAKYLRDCRGDHEQAIRKYLGFVAEFAALQRNLG